MPATSLTSDTKYVLTARDNVIFNGPVAFGTKGGDAAKFVSVQAGGAITGAAANSISTEGGALTLTANIINIQAGIDTKGGTLMINNTGASELSGVLGGHGSGLVKLGGAC